MPKLVAGKRKRGARAQRGKNEVPNKDIGNLCDWDLPGFASISEEEKSLKLKAQEAHLLAAATTQRSFYQQECRKAEESIQAANSDSPPAFNHYSFDFAQATALLGSQEKYLHEQIRPFVAAERRDLVCPAPGPNEEEVEAATPPAVSVLFTIKKNMYMPSFKVLSTWKVPLLCSGTLLNFELNFLKK
ncbi:hypothetical protein CAPTEDRAFT_195599 [Capitella teleta]|uniref:Uncharacterized protein n=1 Tax=Capitella teleta TaxID=283909 RepID=R7UIU0_CAPTE|nr:hypothetical protein CAPTEDRAFT_195599 [Capitella teleta]|eukprot:ELU03202.1 hypothetical protein CAPTEDRAFT_195599 [Capitella teleta]